LNRLKEVQMKKKMVASLLAATAVLLAGCATSTDAPLLETGTPTRYEHHLGYEQRDQLVAEGASADSLAALCSEMAAYVATSDIEVWMIGCKDTTAKWNPTSGYWE
jgi:ABC-type phosphate transport system substrate-binding protein